MGNQIKGSEMSKSKAGKNSNERLRKKSKIQRKKARVSGTDVEELD